MDVKCVGCYDLVREEIIVSGKPLVVYNCPKYFPYRCALSGLLRPGLGVSVAVDDCPQRIDEHCILCHKPPVTSYGDPQRVYACKEHDAAWGKWLDEHPERRAYMAPRHRAIKSRWIEVFREFIEDMRRQVEGEP